MHISAIDLNLAVVLRALFEERSVSRAAKRIGLSQSATSHALARLRAIVGDPLFVRTRAGLVATPRAEAMADAVRDAVTTLERTLLTAPPFDPLTVERTFYVRPSDYVEYLLVPRLLERLGKVAPKIDLSARPSTVDPTLALEQGQLDLLVQPIPANDALRGLHHEPLWPDELVGVVRRGHPLLKGRLTLERFSAASHALVAPSGRPGGMVDDALARRGLTRRIAFATPSFVVAPQVVAQTDLVLVTPARLVAAFAKTLDLVTFTPPLELPGFEIAMFWHDRHDADPAHRLVRHEIAHVAASLSGHRLERPQGRR